MNNPSDNLVILACNQLKLKVNMATLMRYSYDTDDAETLLLKFTTKMQPYSQIALECYVIVLILHKLKVEKQSYVLDMHQM